MKTHHRIVGGLCLLAAILTGAAVADRRGSVQTPLDSYAAGYLDLVARLASLNPESVDFLIAAKDSHAGGTAPTFAVLAERSRTLARRVRNASDDSSQDAGRARNLAQQLDALGGRSAQLGGATLALADELRLLFDVEVAATNLPADNDDVVRDALERRLPGTGSLSARLSRYQRRFIVPRAKLDAVITQAIAACRAQTRRFVRLPEGENLAVEYVADQPWSGYSVYAGSYRSVMQVNRTMPLTIGQALNLACHEGYPGHHTYNTLRESGSRSPFRPEAAALVIFSPEGFRAEALAAAAAAMTFTIDERIRVFRGDLFPLVDFNPEDAAPYAEISDLVDRLAGATTRVVLSYLSGELSADDAARALERDALMEHADGLLAYIGRYRGYSLSYTWGRDRLLSTLTAGAPGPEVRWARLRELMRSPRLQDAALGPIGADSHVASGSRGQPPQTHP